MKLCSVSICLSEVQLFKKEKGVEGPQLVMLEKIHF